MTTLMHGPGVIANFTNTPLSNFSWHPVYYDGIEFPTMEHYFQAMKTLDPKKRLSISKQISARTAKRDGRSLELREDWEHVKLAVMRHGLGIKFAQGTECAAFLLRTGDKLLIEGNNWADRYWGVTQDGKGQNWLGWLLMAQRAYLRGTPA